MSATPSEGVVRFRSDHRVRPLDGRALGEAARALGAWRDVLARLGLLGLDPARYGGLGFGNLSVRLGPVGDVGRGRRRFLVTGTATGGLGRLTLEHLCVVERYDLAANHVESEGPVPPSSESLTHGAVYDVAPAARAVLHAHAPEVWRRARALGLPVTSPHAANGTPALALEVQRLCREGRAEPGLIAMGGHEDGILAFGPALEVAGLALVRVLARALGGAEDPR